jgi:drug/metabolite transporter (DMT)-like permease
METGKLEKKEPSALPGHLAMLIAAMLWGGMSPLAKDIMMTGNVSPIALSSVRVLGGALIFGLACLLPRHITGNESIRKEDRWKIVVAGLVMVAINQGLYIIGVGYTTPVDAAVMTTLTPVITLILSAIFIAMPLSWMKVMGVVFGLSGALLLTYAGAQSDVEPGDSPVLGNMLCLAAQFCAASYFVFFRKLITRYSSFALMSRMFFVSAICYVPFTTPWLLDVDWTAVTAVTWSELAYIIVGATFVSYMLVPLAQKRLKPTTVSMYSYMQPVTAAALAAVMGVATFGIDKALATVLIFGGVAMVACSRGPRTVNPD